MGKINRDALQFSSQDTSLIRIGLSDIPLRMCRVFGYEGFFQ